MKLAIALMMGMVMVGCGKSICYKYRVLTSNGWYYTDSIQYGAKSISFHDKLRDADITTDAYTVEDVNACNTYSEPTK